MRCKLLILCFLISSGYQAQTPGISRYEYLWIFTHPFAAIRVKKISEKCHPVYRQTRLKNDVDSFYTGGTSDAYRHTFYMAAYAQKIKPGKLLKLGQAHEKTNYRQFLKSKERSGELPDSLSSVMDLHNNALGCTLGASHKKLTLNELSDLVLSEIRRGNALILKRDVNGNYADCQGNRLTPKAVTTWYVEKCLIRSDDLTH